MLQDTNTLVSTDADLLVALKELGADATANEQALREGDDTHTAALALIAQWRRLFDLQSAFCDVLLAENARLRQ